jgi:hypothetical protein
MNYNSNSCGALQSDITLAPGETKEFIYILGQRDDVQATAILNEYKAAGKVDGRVQHFSGHYHRFDERIYTSTVSSGNMVKDYTVAANGNTNQSENAFVVLFKRGEGVKEVIKTQF